MAKSKEFYDYLYQDCIQFWMRMGVKKEDNLMALALADINLVYKVKYEKEIWDAYYHERYEKVSAIIRRPEFNENRGQIGFLANSGL